MQRTVWLGLFSMLALALANVAMAEDTDGFKSLFDGKTLDGWNGKPEFWSVKDGAITGTTTKEKPTAGNTFIIFKEPVGDFELHLKYKIVGGNSGIQYRSADKGNNVVHGYQADFEAGDTYSGILYGEGIGRDIMCGRGEKVEFGKDGKATKSSGPVTDAEIKKAIKKEDWNEYVVIAKGNHLIHKINGLQTAEVIDNDPRAVAKGILALQLHAGPPMEVQFKDIKIKELK